MRTPAFACLPLLAACSSETGFGNNNPGDINQEGNAKADFTPTVEEGVEFADLTLGVTRSEILQITSSGENNLVVYEIRIKDSADGAFYTDDEEDVTLAPGIAREFPMTATLLAEGYVEGSVRIKTNDPDALSVEVPLRAWTTGSGPDDTGPDDTGL